MIYICKPAEHGRIRGDGPGTDTMPVTPRTDRRRTPVPATPLPDALRELLGRPNPAVMASLGAEGQPVSVATWYVFDDGRILVNLDEARKRLTHLRRDPRVSLTVLADGNWYTHVSVQGRVTELVDDADLSDIDRISTHYTGRTYPTRDRKRVSAWIEIDRWHGWNTPDETS
jgi:PPOX class probable F420-dependent enzyme